MMREEGSGLEADIPVGLMIRCAGVSVMEGLLGYHFKDQGLLLEACTHPSWQDGSPSYQRLEFLGDAILDLLVTQTLAERYSCPPPTPIPLISDLVRARARCTRQK